MLDRAVQRSGEASGRAASAGGGPGKRTLSEALPAGRTATVSAADAPLEPAAALALAMRGEERPLPHRAALGATAGIALDRIRCLFGPPAQEACARVHAEAFTVGNIIVFGSDAPSQALVQHEVAHVALQQDDGGAVASPPSGLAMSAPGDAHEQAAEAHARGDGSARAPATPVLARYFAANQQVTLYADRHGQVAKVQIAVHTRVAKIFDLQDPHDGWVEVRVTQGPQLETTGFLRLAQLSEHPDAASVDFDTALRLYSELAQGSFDTPSGARLPIPFGYSARDCQARAQAMAQLLAEKGYQSKKVFAVAERDVPPQLNKGNLTARTSLGEPTRWPYHVAPVITVTFIDGEAEMVIDPALHLRQPLTISAWMAAIGAASYRRVGLDQVDAEIFVHDEEQRDRPATDKTILPTGGLATCFVAPSNVYDFMTLDPQHAQDQADSRFLVQGAADLARDHAILQGKHQVISAIQARDAPQTVAALGHLARTERLQLASIPGFVPWLRAQFADPAYGLVVQAFQAP